MLSCGCDYADPSDYDWIYYYPADFTEFNKPKRKRCCSCKGLISKGNLILEFQRARATRSDIEDRIYLDGLVPLANYYMCERCGEIFMNLSELGFCLNIDNPMVECLNEYHTITGFKPEVKNDSNK